MADQPTEKSDGPAPAVDGLGAAPFESKPAQTDSSAKEETKPEGRKQSFGLRTRRKQHMVAQDAQRALLSTECCFSASATGPTPHAARFQFANMANQILRAEPSKPADEPNQAATEHKPEEKSEEKPSAEGDSEMPDAPETAVAEGEQTTGAVAEKTPLTNNKTNRRKSAGGGNNRKSLNKKASKAKITHLDVQPGDHFTVKLKGYPEWPAIIADDTMLPPPILNTRPVTAKRADGTYAEAYADGGKRAQDRNYPVMFLQTNEL